MPSTSKAQQRLFGMVHAYQAGKLRHAPKKIRQIARHISEEDAEHFAKTKHDGLPERKDDKKSEKVEKAEKAAAFIMSLVKRGMSLVKSASQEVVVDTKDKKFKFPSLKSAAAYLASLGSTPISDIKEMLSERQPVINGVRVYYAASQSSQDESASGAEAYGGEEYSPSSESDNKVEFKLTGAYGSNYYG